MIAAPLTLDEFLSRTLFEGAGNRLVEIDRTGHHESRTVAQMAADAQRLAAELTAAPPGDVVLAFFSALDFVPAAWACLLTGRTALLWHEPRAPEAGADARLRAVARRLRDPVLVSTGATVGRLTMDATRPFELGISTDLLSDDGPPAGMPADTSYDAAFLIPTSGTTGAPKLAVIPHAVWWRRVVARGEHARRDSVLNHFPFDSVTGLRIALAPIRETVYVHPGRLAAVPAEIPAAVEAYGVRSVSLAASTAMRVADVLEANPDRYDLSSLKRIGLGSEAIAPDDLGRLLSLVQRGGAREVFVSNGYGATETGLLCRTEERPAEAVVAAAGDGPVGVGPPLPDWSLRIVDGQVEAFSEGLLFAGYRDDPEATAACLTADGWYRTGDRGDISSDGELTLTGRAKATIIANGRTISLEAIEAAVRAAGVAAEAVIATAYRPLGATTDELAVFVAAGDVDFDAVCHDVRAAIGRSSGVAARHVVKIAADEVPRTRTGKVIRDELVRLYRAARWAPHIPAAAVTVAAQDASEEAWLASLWADVLGLDAPPAATASFYALGGDSLAAAEIVHATEARYGLQLDLVAFFDDPTIATLKRLVEQPAEVAEDSPMMHSLASFLRSWQGERLVPGGLIAARNPAGSSAPLCCVFQEEQEFVALSKALGADRPLYGMRSLIGLAQRYTPAALDAVCDQYLPELLTLPEDEPIALGGICQGAIVAVALAHRLRKLARPPALLILMEWSFDNGSWPGPTLLIYGAESYTAPLFEGTEPSPAWRTDFPDHRVAVIPGAHGHLWAPGSIEPLAAELDQALRSRPARRRCASTAARPACPRPSRARGRSPGASRAGR